MNKDFFYVFVIVLVWGFVWRILHHLVLKMWQNDIKKEPCVSWKSCKVDTLYLGGSPCPHHSFYESIGNVVVFWPIVLLFTLMIGTIMLVFFLIDYIWTKLSLSLRFVFWDGLPQKISNALFLLIKGIRES